MTRSSASASATRRSALVAPFGVAMTPHSTIASRSTSSPRRTAKPIPVVPGSMPRTDEGLADFREDLVGDVEVRVDALDVVKLLQCLDQDRHAARAVALVEDLFERAAVARPGGAVDRALDVVLGHADGPGFLDGHAQTEVRLGIPATLPCGEHDVARRPSERLSFLSVAGGFLPLDRAPLRMPGHSPPPLVRRLLATP